MGESITPHQSSRRRGKECLWESVVQDQGSGRGATDRGTRGRQANSEGSLSLNRK